MSLDMDAVKVEEDQSELLACRICLAWDLKLYHIRGSGLDKTFSELMGTSLTASDGLPQHLCSWCRTLLLKAAGLRERCRRADSLLRLALPQRQLITNSYIRTINRSAHKLTHTLSDNLKTNIQFFYENDNTVTNVNDTDIKDEIKPNENKLNDSDDDSEDILEIILNQSDDSDDDATDIKDEIERNENEIIDRDDKAEDILEITTDQSDDSDEEAITNLPEYKYKVENKNVEANVTLAEVKVVETNKNSKRRLKEVNKDTLQNKKQHFKVKKNIEENNDVRIRSVKEKDNSELERFSDLGREEIKELIKKYNFEVQYLTEKEMVEDMERRKVSDRYKNCKFICSLCYKGFLTSTAFDKHMKNHHNPMNAKNECRLCRMTFRYVFHLKQHVYNAHRLRLRCAECDTAVFGRKECVAHAARHAGTTRQCKYCGMSFPYLKISSYTWHMRSAHPAENSAQGSCELCGEIYTSAKGLERHKLLTHSKQATPELQCGRCRTQFDNEQALRTHQQQQQGDKCDPNISACSTCGTGLATAEALMQHIHAAHQVDIFTCDLCNKSFLSKPSLCTHIDRAHRGIRPPQQLNKKPVPYRKLERKHMCEHCGKAYATHQRLKTHLMMHTGERPFKCGRCPKVFTTAIQLTMHTRTHTGERPFQCDQCHLAFTLQGNLIRHQKTVHMGEKPYECSICSKTFTQSGSLTTHVKYVHMKLKPPPRKRNKTNKA